MSNVRYGDITFSSVLAARWAVFFDILGIDYLYEPQSFKIEERVYTPSFFLPGLGDDLANRETLAPPGIFLTVQFLEPTEQELQEALIVSKHTDKNVYLFSGPAMTNGLEWWPSILEAARKCFFSQCPFCGRYGISSPYQERGEKVRASVFSHACMEEHKVPERYNILSHCSQDLRVSAHSPMLDIAYDGARTMQFTVGTAAASVTALRRAVRLLQESKTFCSPEVTEWIIANAHQWAAEKGDFMRFDGAPWWVQHKKDLDASVVPCTCYSCARRTSSKPVGVPPPTSLLQ